MKFEMVMPKMGESITDGTVIKWLKQPGELVEKDEIVLEISTDKVDSEIPTPVAGTIVELLAEENETVDVGIPIAIIETEGKGEISEKGDAAGSEYKEEKVYEQEQESEKEQVESVNKMSRVDKGKESKSFFSPVVLNIANEHNISIGELNRLDGSGMNGRITKKDILAYIDSSEDTAVLPESQVINLQANVAGESSAVEVITMDNMRKRIAEHMVHSKQTSAHVSIYAEVDMHRIAQIRERNKKTFKTREGFGLTFMPFIVESTVKALKEFPFVNAQIDGDNILLKKHYHIGIAVAVEKGLLVPNLFNSDERSLVGLARGINDLAVRARTKKLQPDELSGGTFSISNFGVYGTTIGFPIINQPQVAILGVGAIKKRPVVINDAIGIRPIMYMSLTIDHRLIDGAMGAQFLERIRELLESYDPEMEL